MTGYALTTLLCVGVPMSPPGLPSCEEEPPAMPGGGRRTEFVCVCANGREGVLMSGHYQGKIALRNEEYLIPEEHKERPIGMSTNLQHSRDTYAAVIALVRDDSRHGRFDGKANAERLQVCWNVCANLSTTDLEAGLLNDMHRLLWAAYEEMEEMLITLADTDYNDIKANAICDNIGIVLAKIPETPK